jgi:hypothetical protein
VIHLLRLVACLFVLFSFNTFAVDTDGDGFSDADEAALGTDPNDPTSPLENKLFSNDANRNQFGYSVDISEETLVIGAPYDNHSNIIENSGAAYVFIKNGSLWTQQQKITASDQTRNAEFGWAVKIYRDTIVVSARRMNNQGSSSEGAVYIFSRNAGVWTEDQKLIASDHDDFDYFGQSLSLFVDTIVVGAPGNDDGGSSSGSAYIFKKDSSTSIWSEQQKITANDVVASDSFGSAVGVYGDTAMVWSRFDDDNGYLSGSVYVFEEENSYWSQTQKIIASDGDTEDYFGQSISIHEDTAVIGAPYDDDTGTSSGSVYVFNKVNGVWTEGQKISASDTTENDRFGIDLDLLDDSLVIAANGDDENGFNSGSAYVFINNGSTWIEQQKLIPSDGQATDLFGFSAALSENYFLIGARYEDENGIDAGSAYIFPEHIDTPATISGDVVGSVYQGSSIFGSVIAIDIDGLLDGSYFTITSSPNYGQASINPSSGYWTYVADASFVGSDFFTLTVTDDLGGTTEQNISITITGPDTDGDGIYDFLDNCLNTVNADQSDIDNDTLGDACDNDKDGDGFTTDFDLNDLNAFLSTDPDGDGVDSSGESHYENNVCLKPPGCNDNDPCITVCYVPPQDNCPFIYNSDQNDLDNDNIGNVCDTDADGDGLLISFEDRLGGSDMDANDVSFVLSNANTYFENAPADTDLDGVPDEYETAAGGDTTSSTFESVLAMLSVNKNVPAMGGIGLLILGISIFFLGFIKSKNK